MLNNLGNKAKAALYFAIGMAFFLGAGSLVHFFPQIQAPLVKQPEKNNNRSIDDIYKSLQQDEKPLVLTEVPPQPQNNYWVVYVTGSVRNPGVYRLREGTRVHELVEAAGGLSSVADAVAINMAAPLEDGVQVHVPQKGERGYRDSDRAAKPNVNVDVVIPVRSSPGVRSGGGLIDLNAATEADLKGLPGIGPALAGRIVQYRQKNGRFKEVGDLIAVPGIGGKKLEAVEQLLTVK